MQLLTRSDLQPLRHQAWATLSPTTLTASRQRERKRQAKLRQVHGHVNFDPKTQRLLIRVNPSKSWRNTSRVMEKMFAPWCEVLHDLIHAAPYHLEVLANQQRKGMLLRVVRRGYLRNGATPDAVFDFASFAFRLPLVPITVGPEDPADKADLEAQLHAHPEKEKQRQEVIERTGLVAPLTLQDLRALLTVSRALVVLLDGKEIRVDGLFDGHRLCRFGQMFNEPQQHRQEDPSASGSESESLPEYPLTSVAADGHRVTDACHVAQPATEEDINSEQVVKAKAIPTNINTFEGENEASTAKTRKTDSINIDLDEVKANIHDTKNQTDQLDHSTTAVVDVKDREVTPTCTGNACDDVRTERCENIRT